MTEGVAVTGPSGIATSAFEVTVYLPSAEALVVTCVPLGIVTFTVLLGVASPVTVTLPSLLVVVVVMVAVGAFS